MTPICERCHLAHSPAETDPQPVTAELAEVIRQQACLEAQRAAMLWLLDHVGKKSTCDGPNCGAAIYWITHTNGRRTPYTAAGLNHFVDCPDRDRFKRGKA